VDSENLAAAGLVGNADDDFTVETARPAERLVERFRTVGSGNDHRVLSRLHAIEQGQELRDQPFLGFAGDLAALGRNRVDLIDENDRRRRLCRLLEYLAEPPLALAISGPHDFGTRDVEELGRAFVRDRAGEQRLAGTRRAVQQHALGRIDSEPLEQLGMA
jgi:hypothetical protein